MRAKLKTAYQPDAVCHFPPANDGRTHKIMSTSLTETTAKAAETADQIGDTLIQNTGEGIKQYLQHLFARNEFTSNLLERSITQPIGWIEIGIAASIMLLTFWLSTQWIKRHPIDYTARFSSLRHIGQRILWPALMLLVTLVCLIAWTQLGYRAVWLRLMVLAAQWMILIRLVLGVIHSALPRNKAVDWLEHSIGRPVGLLPILGIRHRQHHYQLDERAAICRRLFVSQSLHHPHRYFMGRHHYGTGDVGSQNRTNQIDGQQPSGHQFTDYVVQHHQNGIDYFIGVDRAAPCRH